MFDGAGKAWRPIVNLLNLNTRTYRIERFSGFRKTRGKQEAGDQGEEDVFECLHLR